MYTVLLYTHGAYNSLLNTVTCAQKNVDCFDYIYMQEEYLSGSEGSVLCLFCGHSRRPMLAHSLNCALVNMLMTQHTVHSM